MRVLQLCNKSPFPAKEGGPIAMNAITEMLLEKGCEIKILAVNTPKYFIKADNIPILYRQKTGIELVFIDTSVRVFKALISLLTNKSYHFSRFESPLFEEKLKEILTENSFDVIQMESVYMMSYIPLIRKYSLAKIFLRAHNVEHKIWERITTQTRNPLKKLYLKILTYQLKKQEISALNTVDAVETISDVDKDYFLSVGVSVPVKTIPFGVNTEIKTENLFVENQSESLFFIGSMDWLPNLEGIRWFLSDVWAKIHAAFPELKFYVAGRNMPEELTGASFPNVEIVGEVSDAKEFMQTNGILIVPLLSGSGIRIKIMEAMMYGKTVITTSIGLEGIDAEDKKHVLIANTPEEFVNNLSFCLHCPEQAKEIGKNAQIFILEKYDRNIIADQLIDFYKQ